jgi:hypothetical protein
LNATLSDLKTGCLYSLNIQASRDLELWQFNSNIFGHNYVVYMTPRGLEVSNTGQNVDINNSSKKSRVVDKLTPSDAALQSHYYHICVALVVTAQQRNELVGAVREKRVAIAPLMSSTSTTTSTTSS